MKKLDGRICDICGKLFYKEDYINEVCDSCINNVWCVINIFEDGSKELSSIHHTQESADLHVFESKDLIEQINEKSNKKLIKQIIENWIVF